MAYEEDTQLTYQHRATASSNCLWKSITKSGRKLNRGLSKTYQRPDISLERRNLSLFENEQRPDTVLYLAYGSNLCNETFRGKRGIKPLSQTNVQVPELRLTFDLPGIAYAEPCFANTAARDPEQDVPKHVHSKDITDIETEDYHKNRWHKGLVGVVYEVTPEDYAHIIATEGGGAAYHDILVDCFPFATSDPTAPVPQFPKTGSFKAHTLFAPATPPGKDPPRGGRLQRPDTSYAQPSARYLKLITDGAAECHLPYEYQDYLNHLRPYTITSSKQRIGQFVFLSMWLPIVTFMFAMQKVFADEQGVAPEWLQVFSGALFQASWASYDNFFRETFGDGERTVQGEDGVATQSKKRCRPSREEVDLCEKGLLEV